MNAPLANPPLIADLLEVQHVPALSAILEAMCNATGMPSAILIRATADGWQICAQHGVRTRAGQIGDAWSAPTSSVFASHLPDLVQTWVRGANPDAIVPMFDELSVQASVLCPVYCADGTYFGFLCATRSDEANSLAPLSDAATQTVLALALAIGTRLTAATDTFGVGKSASAKGKLVSVMRHDLRNPMHSLMAAIEMLQLKPLDPRSERLVGMLERSATRLSELSNQAMDVVRLQLLGDLSMQPIAGHDPVPGLTGVVASVQRMYPERHITTELGSRCALTCDPSRLEQAVGIVLTHAVKHCGAQAGVDVVCRADEHTFEVTIAVPGYILDAAVLPHLFNPFYEPSDELQTVQLGVDLYLAREIAHEHEGKLTVAHQADGVKFVLNLPR